MFLNGSVILTYKPITCVKRELQNVEKLKNQELCLAVNNLKLNFTTALYKNVTVMTQFVDFRMVSILPLVLIYYWNVILPTF